jgi:hypothetical protein
MDRRGEFGYVLWATEGNLIMSKGSLLEFGYARWATARNEAIQ